MSKKFFRSGIRITVGPKKPSEVHLTSSPMFDAPGMIRWALHLGARDFNEDQTAEFVRVGFIASLFPGLKGDEIHRILEGEFKVDGDEVIVERIVA